MKEEDVLNNAIHNLEKEIPITWNWTPDHLNKESVIDGELEIVLNNQRIVLFVDIKKDVKNHQLFNIVDYNKNFQNFLLVAEKLFPKVRKQLREYHINYLEGNGNAYINIKNTFLFIDTNKTEKIQKEKGNRAFTKTGLKVMFHFLLDPQLMNKTQRDIAETTKVALGNIPQIINGLLETNLILKLNKNQYIIEDYKTFLNKWVTEYQQKLKPTIFKKRFKFQNIHWKDINFNTTKTLWGGEPAGDLLTNHLRPEKFMIYTKETSRDLMMNYRLIPDDRGEIWVYEMFWEDDADKRITPEQLTYADLIMTEDKRCTETAELIYDRYIQPNL